VSGSASTSVGVAAAVSVVGPVALAVAAGIAVVGPVALAVAAGIAVATGAAVAAGISVVAAIPEGADDGSLFEHEPPTAKATPNRDTTSRVIGRTIATPRPTMLKYTCQNKGIRRGSVLSIAGRRSGFGGEAPRKPSWTSASLQRKACPAELGYRPAGRCTKA
jgi:hypothetical protein